MKNMKRHHYILIVSVLINVLFLIGMAHFVGFYYELSDDWFFSRNIANGNYNYTFCSFFIQLLSGLLQKLIYPVNAFMLLQILLSFVSFTTISYILFDLYGTRKGLIFTLLVEALFCVNFYSIITFSKTAAILAVAGGLVMLWAHHEKKPVGYSIYGIILILLGSFYRMKIFYAVAAVFCVCIGALVLCRLRKPFWKSLVEILKEIFTVRNIVLIVSLLALVFGCDFLSTRLAFASDEGVAYYKEYNHLRSSLVDYPLPDYADYAEEFQEIGVSENDYNMLKNWYFDDHGFCDMETMEKIIEIQQKSQYSGAAVVDRMKVMVKSVLVAVRDLTSEGLVFLTALFVGVVLIATYRKQSWIMILTMALGIGVLYVYLWYGGRVRFRAILPVWIAAAVCVLYSIRFMRCRPWVEKMMKRLPREAGWAGVAVALALCGVIQYHTAIVVPEENRIVNDYEYSDLMDCIVESEDKTFVLSYDSYKFLRNRTVLQDPLYVGLDPVFDACLFFGSPYYAHPSYNAFLEEHGVQNLYTDIVDDEQFLYVDRRNKEIEMFVAYLAEQYPVEDSYSFELVDVLNSHYIYKIRTGGTNKAVVLRSQPQDVTVASGEIAKVTLDVVGVGLTYDWYWAGEGETEFLHTDTFDGRTYYLEMNADRDGRRVYCVVTDQYGNSVRTSTVTLSMEDAV